MLIQMTALLCVLGISAGQILFKLGAISLGQTGSYFAPKTAAIFVVALAIYVVATVAWVFILQKVELGRIYPLMALAFVFVPLGGYLILGERFQPQYLVGVAMIIIGIVTAVRS